MTADDPRNAVLARRAEVLRAAGHALERSVRRRRARRRLASAGAVALVAVGALIAGWPRPGGMPASVRPGVALTVLRGGESPANVTVIRAGRADTIALRPIGDDELDAELLSAFGERFGAVGVIRQGRSVAVIDAATGQPISLGLRPADE
jgi:hypothetical protein